MDAEVIERVIIAAALGAAIGMEREISGQEAGLRTHASVALGAALFGIVSTLGFDEFFDGGPGRENVRADVTRVASNVVVGIGFLGAGVIFRYGMSVKNLTTAASLWVTAAIGLAVGVGDPGAASFASLVLLAVLALLRPVRSLVQRLVVHPVKTVRVELASGAEPDALLADLASEDGVALTRHTVLKAAGAYVVEAELRARPGASLDACLSRLARRSDVRTLRDETDATGPTTGRD